MFVLLFRYVFGGAIRTPGYSYGDFLIPGIIVQNIAFGGFVTALGPERGPAQGADRPFRSLPMARPAVLAGRTISDIFTNALSMAILLVTGVIIGFTLPHQFARRGRRRRLLLLFGYAFSWFFAFVGLLVSTPESANSVAFIVVFPLTSSRRRSSRSDDADAAQAFAEVNPFTIVVDALRHLWLGAPAQLRVGCVRWSLVIVAVFARWPSRATGGRRAVAGPRPTAAPPAAIAFPADLQVQRGLRRDHGEQHDHDGRRARGGCADADRGFSAHGRQPPGHRRRTLARRQRLADLVGATRAAWTRSPGAGEARREAGRHRRDHARQPPRVPHRRPRGSDARRDPVLDLHHLSGRGDRVSVDRFRRAGGDRRAGVPAGDARGAPAAARARARDRGRR